MNSPIIIDKIHDNIYATFAPGKKDNKWNRDLDNDLHNISQIIDVLICLLPNDELHLLKIQNISEKCKEMNLSFIHYPLIDNSVPDSPQHFHEFISRIDKLVIDGKKICFFCRGGLGRTGLCCASLLVVRNMSATDAIKTVRQGRKRALGRKHQQQYISTFSKYNSSLKTKL